MGRTLFVVSKHSLYAMEILAEKSALQIAPLASAIFAPMLVPLFSNCLDRTNSFFFLLSIYMLSQL